MPRRGEWIRLGAELPAAMVEYGRLSASSERRVVDLIDQVLTDAKDRVAANTLKNYRVASIPVKRAFFEFAPDEVKPTDINKFMEFHRKTPSLANHMRCVLKLALDIAVRAGEIDHNPVSEIPRHKERKRDRYLSDEEYERLLTHASPVLAAIICVAYYTAQRIGDVLAIRLSDITDEGVKFRQQKTGVRLMVTMTPGLREAIDDATRLHGATPRLFLFGQRNGRPRSYSGVLGLFTLAAAKAGIEDARLHDLRAKSITDAERQGLDPKRLAGHASEAQTRRYLRSREEIIVSGPSFGQRPVILDSREKTS